MRKSKYLGFKSGDWECTYTAVADVQPKYCRRRVNGKRVLSKSPGSMQYYYIFERLTSDGKAMKMIRLNASQAQKVLNNRATVEDFANKKAKKAEKKSPEFKDKISYSFCH